jgi:hypothetical protein
MESKFIIDHEQEFEPIFENEEAELKYLEGYLFFNIVFY